MTSDATGGEAPLNPEAATAQKATLMASAEWRAGAMQAGSQQWAEMTRLNEAIAAGQQAREDADEAEVEAMVQKATTGKDAPPVDDEPDDPEALAAIHRVPERPGQYELPTHQASDMGLKVDAGREIELRQAFHAAEVTQSLATVMYMAAMTEAKNRDQSDAGIAVRQQAEYLKSAHALHQKWGTQYEANLAVANAEARQIFEKLPVSMTRGVSYADWCRSSGIANNRIVVEQLLNRAKARAQKGHA